jgi:hypothetical protein
MYITIIAVFMTVLSLVRMYQEIIAYCTTRIISLVDVENRNFGIFNINIIRNSWVRKIAKPRNFDERLIDILINKFPEKLDKNGSAKMSKNGTILELQGSFNDDHYHFRRLGGRKPWVEVKTAKWVLTKAPFIHPTLNPTPKGNWVKIGDNYFVGGDIARFEDDVAIIALTHN